MKSDAAIKLVFCKLMLLFNVNRIKFIRLKDGRIEALVGWPDEGQSHYDPEEEIQFVSWVSQVEQLSLDVSTCLDYVALNSLLRGDRICIDQPQLILRLMNFYGWGLDRTRLAIEAVLSIRVDMIDEGIATDAFFLHF